MTRTIEKEDQALIKEALERVNVIADDSLNEGEFLSRANNISEVKKIFPSRQSASGGITFSVIINYTPLGEKNPRTKTATIKKKFPKRC
jgi:shikimate 5-dehydrogenase